MGNSFPVHFALKNTPDNLLKSKMFGKAHIEASKNQKTILIPSSSIIGSDVKPQVYLIVDGKAKLHDISISRRLGAKAVVSKGIKEGDVIITAGFINLFDDTSRS